MQLKMVSLTRRQNGAYSARKGIPADVRERYFALYGVRRERKFYASSRAPLAEVKQRFAEWSAETDAQIATIRQEASGDGRSLSHREAHALAGEWYAWFVALSEDEPGNAVGWEEALAAIARASCKFVPDDMPSDEAAEFIDEDEDTRAHMAAVAADAGMLTRFLLERTIILSRAGREKLQRAMLPEYLAAVALLKRRACGDFAADTRPERFPVRSSSKLVGMTCWQLFEAWVRERKPKASTVDRRRGVFLHLKERFGDRDISTITEHEAVEWKDSLLTAERSGRTINDVWLVTAKGIFGWAVTNKKITSNPFAGLKVAYAQAAQNRESRAFTEKEASTILAASLADPPKRLASHYKAARRWVPWICAYSGMRVQEATQLRGDDLVEVDGIWAIRIRPDAGTQKTNRARTVPIHEHLIEQGFVVFAQAYGERPMFYDGAAQKAQKPSDATNPQKPLAVKSREHLAKWVRDIGVSDPELAPNHSWRHLFKELGDHCGIPEKVSDAITGHAPANEARKYGRVRLEVMARELGKLPRFMVG